MRIENPLIELLAIKLYEHDHDGHWSVENTSTSWMAIGEEDRRSYRRMAQGRDQISDNDYEREQ